MKIEQRLIELGLALPQPARLPPGVAVPFSWVRCHGDRAYVSGHGPTLADGALALPLGKVGLDVSADQAYQAARLAALAMLGSLARELGDLDRIAAWLTVSGMVNVAPGFVQTTNVINGASDLLLEVFGASVGAHARTAIGMAQLPANVPVIVAAELALHPAR